MLLGADRVLLYAVRCPMNSQTLETLCGWALT